MVLGAALVAATAQAREVEIVLTEAEVRPGRATTVWVAVSPPPVRPPAVTVDEGSVRFAGRVGDGVWAFTLLPPVFDDELEVRVRLLDGLEVTRSVPLVLPPPSRLRLQDRIVGAVREGEVAFRVSGPDVPPPEALEVLLSEGTVVGVAEIDGELEVRVLPEEQPFPRYIPIGVRDLRRLEEPAWGGIRIRARPRIPLRSEPGSSLMLSVGGRSYGPFEADASGAVEAWVDQYPGELVATAVATDDLGNQSRTDLPLAGQTATRLVASTSGGYRRTQPPPVLFLHAAGGDGSSWAGDRPSCRTPSVDLSVRSTASGRWYVPLPGLASRDAEDLRVECSLGGLAAANVRVQVEGGVPDTMRMRVWPTDLRSDFPVSEVRIVLEDARGERLSVDGVRVRAKRGDVVMSDIEGTVARGEYVGSAAVEAGEDELVAVYEAPAGDGWADRLDLGWGPVPLDGRVVLHARAVDALERPLEGIPLELTAGQDRASATTGSDGWATAKVHTPDGAGPVVFEAAGAGRIARGVSLREADGVGGPGTADLEQVQPITISPGRVAGISLLLDPPILRATPGAKAVVRVVLEDRTGSAITDEDVYLEVSEGTVSELVPQADGSYRAEYLPPTGSRTRKITITARTDVVRTSDSLEVIPREITLSVGPWGGVQTNFGVVRALALGLDLDVRTRQRVLGTAAIVRLGAWGYRFSETVTAVPGEPLELTSSLYPAYAGVLLRDDRAAPLSLWAGLGLGAALHVQQSAFGSEQLDTGIGVLPTGLLMGGVGRRLLGGELALELRTSFLPGPGGELGFVHGVGGVAVGLGYRLVY